MFNSFQTGSVCELCFEFLLVRIARFCGLCSLLLSCPQNNKPQTSPKSLP